jgi:hypothetical protein
LDRGHYSQSEYLQKHPWFDRDPIIIFMIPSFWIAVIDRDPNICKMVPDFHFESSSGSLRFISGSSADGASPCRAPHLPC